MLIIADARLPLETLRKLRNWGNLFGFSSRGIVYDSISGHPDVFLCQTPDAVVVAPNAPDELKAALQLNRITTLEGSFEVGNRYPHSARYNAWVGDNLLVHKLTNTDSAIMQICHDFEHLNVAQAYTRCNLVEVKGLFITSDKGIEKAISGIGREVFYIDPRCIVLPGQKNGFIGGCMGYWQHQLFLAGSVRHFPEGPNLKKALVSRNVQLVELYDGPLFDGGAIMFLSAVSDES